VTSLSHTWGLFGGRLTETLSSLYPLLLFMLATGLYVEPASSWPCVWSGCTRTQLPVCLQPLTHVSRAFRPALYALPALFCIALPCMVSLQTKELEYLAQSSLRHGHTPASAACRTAVCWCLLLGSHLSAFIWHVRGASSVRDHGGVVSLAPASFARSGQSDVLFGKSMLGLALCWGLSSVCLACIIRPLRRLRAHQCRPASCCGWLVRSLATARTCCVSAKIPCHLQPCCWAIRACCMWVSYACFWGC
jgi:hypothetical protein